MKTLILTRHAHRDTSDRAADNGLSDKGLRQAKDIHSYYERHWKKTHPLILSSPKRRCLETLVRIADSSGVELKQSPELEEQRMDESDSAFRKRIERFLKWWMDEAPELTLICSHGDWLPIALDVAVGARAKVEKGAWIVLQLDEGRPILSWLMQGLSSR
jgi:broad specificity phosphatase PhoE